MSNIERRVKIQDIYEKTANLPVGERTRAVLEHAHSELPWTPGRIITMSIAFQDDKNSRTPAQTTILYDPPLAEGELSVAASLIGPMFSAIYDLLTGAKEPPRFAEEGPTDLPEKKVIVH